MQQEHFLLHLFYALPATPHPGFHKHSYVLSVFLGYISSPMMYGIHVPYGTHIHHDIALNDEEESSCRTTPLLKNGGYLLSHKRSTIGAVGLNFSVRNGKRWNPDTRTT